MAKRKDGSRAKEVLKNKENLEQITKAAFDTVDTDGSGFLEKDELATIMENIANSIGVEKPTTSEVDEVLKELDANNDGKLSLSEFQVLIKQVLEMMGDANDAQDQ